MSTVKKKKKKSVDRSVNVFRTALYKQSQSPNVRERRYFFYLQGSRELQPIKAEKERR